MTTMPTARKPRRSPRYTVRTDAHGIVVLFSDSPDVLAALGDPGDSLRRTYWVPDRADSYSYVREITDDRPGSLGAQVCDRLAATGCTLSCRRSQLARVVRYELRSALRRFITEDR